MNKDSIPGLPSAHNPIASQQASAKPDARLRKRPEDEVAAQGSLDALQPAAAGTAASSDQPMLVAQAAPAAAAAEGAEGAGANAGAGAAAGAAEGSASAGAG